MTFSYTVSCSLQCLFSPLYLSHRTLTSLFEIQRFWARNLDPGQETAVFTDKNCVMMPLLADSDEVCSRCGVAFKLDNNNRYVVCGVVWCDVMWLCTVVVWLMRCSALFMACVKVRWFATWNLWELGVGWQLLSEFRTCGNSEFIWSKLPCFCEVHAP